jgi:hypothetical protein
VARSSPAEIEGTAVMYLFGSKIKRSKTRNKSARYRAKLKKKNAHRRARMVK